MTKQEPTPMTDDFDDILDDPVKCREAQFAEALVDLARAVDLARNDEARVLLIRAMDSLVYQLNPPRGELKHVKK